MRVYFLWVCESVCVSVISRWCWGLVVNVFMYDTSSPLCFCFIRFPRRAADRTRLIGVVREKACSQVSSHFAFNSASELCEKTTASHSEHTTIFTPKPYGKKQDNVIALCIQTVCSFAMCIAIVCLALSLVAPPKCCEPGGVKHYSYSFSQLSRKKQPTRHEYTTHSKQDWPGK